MKNYLNTFTLIVSYFFILLFVYASISKILDFENFQVQIAQSPLLSSYAGFISNAVIAAEIIISGLLIFQRSRLNGLYASLLMMVSFTVYIYLILHYSEFIPCSCGGILEKLGWEEHLLFNIVCIVLATVSIYVLNRSKDSRLRISFSVAGCFIFGSALVLILFFSSENLIKKNNQFIRRFPHHLIQEDKILDLKVNSYYFAGVGNGKIFLGNYTNPLVLTEVDDSLKYFKQYLIKLDNYNHQFKFLKLHVRDSHFFLTDGSVPIVYKGKIKESLANTVSYKKIYFDQLAMIDSSTAVFRTINPITRTRSLGIINLSSGNYHLNSDIIKKQKDGIFDTDGILSSDNDTNDYYYTYYYRNILVSINLKDQFSVQNTIDTTSTAKIQTKIVSNGKMKMTAPPVVVNKMTTASQGLLFNQSNLMGHYENRDQWKKNSIIDIYNTKAKSYRGSFYVQHKGKNKMIQMFATAKYFYTLIGNEIIRYRYAQTIVDDLSKGKAENLNSE